MKLCFSCSCYVIACKHTKTPSTEKLHEHMKWSYNMVMYNVWSPGLYYPQLEHTSWQKNVCLFLLVSFLQLPPADAPTESNNTILKKIDPSLPFIFNFSHGRGNSDLNHDFLVTFRWFMIYDDLKSTQKHTHCLQNWYGTRPILHLNRFISLNQCSWSKLCM